MCVSSFSEYFSLTLPSLTIIVLSPIHSVHIFNIGYIAFWLLQASGERSCFLLTKTRKILRPGARKYHLEFCHFECSARSFDGGCTFVLRGGPMLRQEWNQ
jgi:hypothetical protein